MKAWFHFASEAFHNYSSLGTLFPTSRMVANSIIAAMADNRSGLRVLEVGAGTGSITIPLVQQLDRFDSLAICEINPKLVEVLSSRLAHESIVAKNLTKISLFRGRIQDFPTNQKFDYIICSLPFLSFSRATVTEIFERLEQLAAEGAIMSFVEYVGIRQMMKALPGSRVSKRTHENESYLRDLGYFRPTRVDRVWWNLPPLDIYETPLGGNREPLKDSLPNQILYGASTKDEALQHESKNLSFA